jgi:hypothetical protein
MHSAAARRVCAVAIVALWFAGPGPSWAQTAGGTVSGAVTDPSGAAIAGAQVSVKNLASGQSTEARTNSAGAYTISNLAPGDYEVSVSAAGFTTRTTRVTLVADARQNLDLVLAVTASKAAAPSLSDLGFRPEQIQGSAEEQARLDKRSHMLKIHQRLGLITTAPLVATVIAGTFAGGRQPTTTGRRVHAALGSLTAGLYATTASFAIFAPKVPGSPARGSIRAHRILAWIHGTGMILTPVLGAMAYAQRGRGERVHGLASWHGPVGIVTAGAYGAAIMAVSVKF